MRMGLVVLCPRVHLNLKSGHRPDHQAGRLFYYHRFVKRSPADPPRGSGPPPLRGRRDGPSLPRLRLGGSSRVRARPEAVPMG